MPVGEERDGERERGGSKTKGARRNEQREGGMEGGREVPILLPIPMPKAPPEPPSPTMTVTTGTVREDMAVRLVAMASD